MPFDSMNISHFLSCFKFCNLISKGLVAQKFVAFKFFFSGVNINDVSYSYETNSDQNPSTVFQTPV